MRFSTAQHLTASRTNLSWLDRRKKRGEYTGSCLDVTRGGRQRGKSLTKSDVAAGAKWTFSTAMQKAAQNWRQERCLMIPRLVLLPKGLLPLGRNSQQQQQRQNSPQPPDHRLSLLLRKNLDGYCGEPQQEIVLP